jgi:hypothetical protein
MCDLTPSGSNAISHLAFHFVNEEMPQILKNRRIALAIWVSPTYGGAGPKRTGQNSTGGARHGTSVLTKIGQFAKFPAASDSPPTCGHLFRYQIPNPRLSHGPQDRGFSAGKGVHSP